MGKGAARKQEAPAPQLTREDKESVLEGGSGGLLDAVNKSKLLNSLTKGEVKQMAKSKDAKAREFVLNKEQFEKQQVARAAKEERDAQRAAKEQAKEAREDKLKQQLGKSATMAGASVFTEMAMEEQVAEDKGRSKKQLRRGRGAKGQAGEESDSEEEDLELQAAPWIQGVLAFVLALAVVAVLFADAPMLAAWARLLEQHAPGLQVAVASAVDKIPSVLEELRVAITGK